MSKSLSKTSEQHIILFGGAFDPIHLGHQQVVKNILAQNLADQVWYVPTGVHDFEKQMTSAQHRLAMLNLVLEPNTQIEKCELNRQTSHTFDTLEELSHQHPKAKFSWLIGSDNLAKFHLWHNWQEMLSKYQFFVYPRVGFEFDPLYQNMVPLKTMPKVAISSTQIRELMHSHNSINGLVDPRVEEYIIKHGLYQS